MVLILLVLLASLVCNPTAAAELPSELPASAKAEEAGFRFSDMGWSKEEDNFFEYVPNQGVFERGKRVYGFMEVTGFENYYTNEIYHIDLTVDVYLKTGFGLRLFGQRDVIEFDDTAKEPIEDIWFYLWVDIPWWAPPGSYIAEVVVRDRIGNQKIVHSERIRVR
ncbi:MAG TPA: hypothetical protein GX739_05260 [Firmicutes bacterium]|nr:hypothetical protein [Bacillota bacterium]